MMSVSPDALLRPQLGSTMTIRAAWLVAGVAAAVASAVVGSPWLLAAWLAPDLGVLAGGLPLVDDAGRLRPAAARGYNATHAPWAPPVLAAVALATGSTALLAVAALWFSHIGIDRALGYGLRPVHA
jgi:hypothetical protein